MTTEMKDNGAKERAIALVGTYREKQLDWICEHGVYNYPVKVEDGLKSEDCGKVRELWLYAGAKAERHCFAAEFVGIQSRDEFLAANPTYAKLGKRRASSHPHSHYMVFKVTRLYSPKLEKPLVVARVCDFAKRTPKIAKAIKEFQNGGDFASLADSLPTELSALSHEQLCVCEEALQLDFLSDFDRENLFFNIMSSMKIADQAHADGRLTCVEICAGAGGQAIGLERAGFAHVALVEYEPDYCAVLKQNKPEWNVICADVRNFDGHPYAGVDLLAGGVPCPPFSVASKQLGQNDERDLFPEAIRLIGEIIPKAVMIENVRGLLDPKFDEYRNSILEKIDALGYNVQIKLLHASDFGVPQIRPRVVIVGIRKDLKCRFDYPEANAEAAPTVGEALHDMMSANGWREADTWAAHANTIAPTIVGGSKKHGGPDLGPTRARRAWAELGVDGLGIANEPPAPDFTGNPKLTKEMMAVIQGFPREWSFGRKKTLACRMIGNAFPPPVAMAVGKQIRRCLINEK